MNFAIGIDDAGPGICGHPCSPQMMGEGIEAARDALQIFLQARFALLEKPQFGRPQATIELPVKFGDGEAIDLRKPHARLDSRHAELIDFAAQQQPAVRIGRVFGLKVQGILGLGVVGENEWQPRPPRT